jgi:hypothetical protein
MRAPSGERSSSTAFHRLHGGVSPSSGSACAATDIRHAPSPAGTQNDRTTERPNEDLSARKVSTTVPECAISQCPCQRLLWPKTRDRTCLDRREPGSSEKCRMRSIKRFVKMRVPRCVNQCTQTGWSYYANLGDSQRFRPRQAVPDTQIGQKFRSRAPLANAGKCRPGASERCVGTTRNLPQDGPCVPKDRFRSQAQ